MKSYSSLFFSFCILMAASQMNGEEKKPVSLGKVVVADSSEDETHQTGDVSREEASSFFSVIKKEDFEGKVDNLSEVIEKEAGVQIRQSGGLGSFSSVSLRGASSQQVLIYVDGVLLNGASGNIVDLSNISLSDVESIEIYRGVTPVNFGKASIGGVVNIKTKRSKKKLIGSVSAGYGSFNTFNCAAFLNHKPGKFDYLINADYISSKNDYEILNDNGTPENPDDNSWEKRNNNEFSQANILTKLGYDFTKDIRLIISNQYFAKNQNIPNYTNSENADTAFDTMRNLSITKYTINDIGSFHFNTAGMIDFSSKVEDYDDENGSRGLGNQHLKYLTTSYGYNHFFEWPSESNILTLVTDIHRENFDVEDLLGDYEFNPSWRNIICVGVEDSIFLFSEKIILKPGLRYFYINDELKSGVDSFGDPTDARSRSRHYFNPQLGIKFNASKWLALKGNIARYIREPSFFELFGDRGQFMGNAELKPEESINYDAGVEIKYKRKSKFLSRININFSYFRNDIKDIIFYSYDSRGTGIADNLSVAHIQGIEMSIIIDFLKYFNVSGNYTWQDTINFTKGDDADGQELPGRFEHSLFGKIEAKYRWIKLSYEYVFEKGMYYDSPNIRKASDKNEHNLGLSLTKWDFTLTFKAKNISECRYEDFARSPQPGRSYYVTLKYNFKTEKKKKKNDKKDKKEIKDKQ